ncbi:MAG: HalOD1 output domain-containing protein [Haloferacaceae archaeon]
MAIATNGRSSGEGALTTAIAEAVSAASGTPIRELPPLYDAIDPDALSALFSGRRTSGRVEFRYAGHVVAVTADRTVDVSPDR